MMNKWVSNSCVHSFPLVGEDFLVQSQCDGFCFILYFILPCLGWSDGSVATSTDCCSKVKTDAKKKSYRNLELSIIQGYLFRGRLTNYSPLLKWEKATESSRQEPVLYMGIYSIRGHTQVGG